MTNKHPSPQDQPVDLPDDLETNPGIGQSKGVFARESSDDAGLIEGDNTIEGDRGNDSALGGGADPNDLGRTNK
jgi:hypothetical protein